MKPNAETPPKKTRCTQKKEQPQVVPAAHIQGDVHNSNIVVGNNNTIDNSTTTHHETNIIHAAKPREFAAYTVLVILLIGLLALGINYSYFRYDRAIASGKLNVLIVPFVEKKPWGYTNSDLGWSIAQIFSDGVQKSFESTGIATDIKVLGPSDKVPKIHAFNEAQLGRSAETISEKINGQIVIYGVVTEDEYGDSIVQVKFYISPTNFGEAQELISDSMIGELSLGSFRLTGDTVNGADLLAQNEELRDRLEIFSAIINFLGAYIGEDFERAQEYITQAGTPRLWNNTSGLEVLSLLNGNMEIRHVRVLMVNKDLEGVQNSLEAARHYFNKALDISTQNGNGDYVRAYLGLAGTESLAAIAEANIHGEVSQIDTNALERSLQYLDEAEAATYQPATADVSAKVNYSRAQIALAYLAKTGSAESQAEAGKYYELVVEEYNQTGNKRITELAALSYSGLGHLASLAGQPDSAIEHFLSAQKITSNPSLKVQCLVNAGDIYFANKKYDQALKYYQDALLRRNELEKAISSERIMEIEQRINFIKTGGSL